MKDIERLRMLLDGAHDNLDKWIIGTIPKHFKRCNIDYAERLRLAKLGAMELCSFYNNTYKPFFCQALLAGAIMSGDYDDIVVVTPSQWGKSFTLAHTALPLAYKGEDVRIAGANKAQAGIIMKHVRKSVGEMIPPLQVELAKTQKTSVERLESSLSKDNIAFPGKGSVTSITLGDSYSNLATNQAVGTNGITFIDEAALISEGTLAELGRRDFANIDGTKQLQVMISNPHATGYFYDCLTEEEPNDRTLILWMDALTAMEEGRFTYKQIMTSEFAKRRSELRRYLLCELDEDENGMFEKPRLDDEPIQGNRMSFLGVDAAYKGKDNIVITMTSLTRKGLVVEDVATVKKGEWIDGVTSQDIINDILRVYRRFHCKFICVDIGYGVWLVEGLARGGANVRGIGFGNGTTKARIKAEHYAAKNGYKKRDELHLDLQELIEKNRIAFRTEAYNKIKDTLPWITSKRKGIGEDGKVVVVPKSEIKPRIGRSPDELDSVLLSIHAWILYTGMNFQAIY